MCALPYILDLLSKYFWGLLRAQLRFGVLGLCPSVWRWWGDSDSGAPSRSDSVLG